MNREELLKEINKMSNYALASLVANGKNEFTCKYCINNFRDKNCLETNSCIENIEEFLSN